MVVCAPGVSAGAGGAPWRLRGGQANENISESRVMFPGS